MQRDRTGRSVYFQTLGTFHLVKEADARAGSHWHRPAMRSIARLLSAARMRHRSKKVRVSWDSVAMVKESLSLGWQRGIYEDLVQKTGAKGIQQEARRVTSLALPLPQRATHASA